ncbi:MAG: ABC transporter ATP-binding protein [Bacillota bacterium]|nr:ABC transporter ATP-binding protein [Bacillota bacterium]
MEEIILETKDLCFNNMINYKDMKISKGKVTFITGESGSGKSTLLKLFNGTLTQSKGKIYFNGEDTQQLNSIKLRKKISLISQNVFLFDASIKENFIKFYEYRGQNVPSDEKIKEILNICCITFPLDKDCRVMSGGEKQRIYIAIYLSFGPEIIMLDEPTSALDNKNTFAVIENILSFCKKNNSTVIIVSHDKELTEKFGESNITIERG